MDAGFLPMLRVEDNIYPPISSRVIVSHFFTISLFLFSLFSEKRRIFAYAETTAFLYKTTRMGCYMPAGIIRTLLPIGG